MPKSPCFWRKLSSSTFMLYFKTRKLQPLLKIRSWVSLGQWLVHPWTLTWDRVSVSLGLDVREWNWSGATSGHHCHSRLPGVWGKSPWQRDEVCLSPDQIPLSFVIPSLVSESKSEVAQSCPTLCDPVDCSPPGSSVHGILQARMLEWVAISFSRGSSWPGDQTQVSCITGRGFILREALVLWSWA